MTDLSDASLQDSFDTFNKFEVVEIIRDTLAEYIQDTAPGNSPKDMEARKAWTEDFSGKVQFCAILLGAFGVDTDTNELGEQVANQIEAEVDGQ